MDLLTLLSWRPEEYMGGVQRQGRVLCAPFKACTAVCMTAEVMGRYT